MCTASTAALCAPNGNSDSNGDPTKLTQTTNMQMLTVKINILLGTPKQVIADKEVC